LVHDPRLIILDEPTNGLDPQGIADIRNLIIQLSKERNKTLLISSHLLSEIELIADSMIIIDKGKKVVEGKVKELFDPAETVVELRTTDDSASFEKLQHTGLKKWLSGRRNDCILLKLHRDDIPSAMKELINEEISVLSFHSKHSLEDYFLSLTTGRQHVDTSKN
jgi:ABC-type multidrug transport system ATPase subunit